MKGKKMGDLLTADEVARRLRLRPSTVKRWTQEGILPAVRLSGKVIRFDWDAVTQAIQARTARTQKCSAAGGC